MAKLFPCARVLELALIGSIGIAATAGSEVLVEKRGHWIRPAPSADAPAGATDAERQVLLAEVQASFITRNVQPSGESRLSAATSTERIALFELEGPGLRFGWWEKRDYGTGQADYILEVWPRGGAAKWRLKVHLDFPITGGDLRGFLDEGAKLKARGALPSDDMLLATVDFAGRRLMVPVSEWERGLSLPSDREWLKSVLLPSMVEQLKLIDVISSRDEQLSVLCNLVIHPLLNEPDEPCKPHGSFVHALSDADCDFDAQFGETCSLKDALQPTGKKTILPAPPK